jgi:hypothetical protein
MAEVFLAFELDALIPVRNRPLVRGQNLRGAADERRRTKESGKTRYLFD